MNTSFSPPRHVSTERLRFCPLTEADAPFVFSYASDPEVTRLLSFLALTEIEQAKAFIRRCDDEWGAGTAFTWLLRQTDGPPVGAIELRPHGHWAETGYVLARPFWGRGFMTEAVRALMEWSLGQDGVVRFAAFCDAENHGSRRVLEKAGMTLEGVLRQFGIHPNVSPEPRDCCLYARVR